MKAAIMFFVIGMGLIAFAAVILARSNMPKESTGDFLRDKHEALIADGRTALYGIPPAFLSGGEDLTQEEAMEEAKKATRALRTENIAAWQDFLRESEAQQNDMFAANALFYLALNHYANAGDFGDAESANTAVQLLKQSLSLDPGNPAAGYRTIDVERRRYLEYALILKQSADEQERQKQQEQNQQGLAPTPKDNEEGSASPDEGGLGDLPVLGQGAKP